MTIAEQLEAQNSYGWRHRIWQGVQVLIAVAVLTMSLLLYGVNSKASDTASQAKQTATIVKTALSQSIVAICQSRKTTLRTAPETVKEIRSVIDAESAKARKVCPQLDYPQLDTERRYEIARLAAGADPEAIALRGEQGSVGATGTRGAVGARGRQGVDGHDGRDGKSGARGASGSGGPAGPAGPRGATGMQGPAGPAGPAGPVGPVGPRGPAGPGVSVAVG